MSPLPLARLRRDAPRRGSRSSPGVGGFTLIELTLILIAIPILSVVSVVSFSGLRSSRQDVAATRVRAALIYAQQWAVGSGNDTWVLFDSAKDQVSVFVEHPKMPGRADRLQMSDPLTRGPMTIQLGLDGAGIESVDIGATSEVQFDSLGVPHNAKGAALATDGTVGLTGQLTVRITKNTGLITVEGADVQQVGQ